MAVPTQPSANEVISVNKEKHDFGKIKLNVPVTYHFVIKNISSAPIVVENTWASCGCTTPEKITAPILPGATAPLKIVYKGAVKGAFIKDVYIKIAGIDQPKVVVVSGVVE